MIVRKFQLPDYSGAGIYEIRNNRTGYVYIGSSVNIRKRIQEHESAIKRGLHDCEKLYEDYTAGHDFTVSIVKKIHVRFVKEIQNQEAEEIQKRLSQGELLYNSQPIYDRYSSRNTMLELMADRYSREHFGKPLYKFATACPAEIDMMCAILRHPDKEPEIREKYDEVISYQTHQRYYASRGKDYDIEIEKRS